MLVAHAQYKLCVLKKGVRLSKIVRTACTFGMIFSRNNCMPHKEGTIALKRYSYNQMYILYENTCMLNDKYNYVKIESNVHCTQIKSNLKWGKLGHTCNLSFNFNTTRGIFMTR